MAAVEAQFSGQLLIAGGDGTPFARGDGFDRVEAEYRDIGHRQCADTLIAEGSADRM